MKLEFESQDIEVLAKGVVEHLRPLLSNDSTQSLEEEILTIHQTALLLKTNKAQIYQWVNNSRHGLGDFPYLKAGRLLRFSRKAIMAWLEANSKR